MLRQWEIDDDGPNEVDELYQGASTLLNQLTSLVDEMSKPVRTSNIAVWLYDGGEEYYQEAVRFLAVHLAPRSHMMYTRQSSTIDA